MNTSVCNCLTSPGAVTPVSKKLYPFTTALPLISSCNSFCSLLQPPASPQIGGMDTAVSPIHVSFLSYILTAGAWYQSWTIYVFRLTHSTYAL